MPANMVPGKPIDRGVAPGTKPLLISGQRQGVARMIRYFRGAVLAIGLCGQAEAQVARPLECAGQVVISVGAAASKQIWSPPTTNTLLSLGASQFGAVIGPPSTIVQSTPPRSLAIVPDTTTCRLDCSATAATNIGATSMSIPNGLFYNLTLPPPSTACYAYCTSATHIAVDMCI